MEVDGEFNIGGVSDADCIAEIVHRKLGLKVLEQYPRKTDLPAIPEASNPEVFR